MPRCRRSDETRSATAAVSATAPKARAKRTPEQVSEMLRFAIEGLEPRTLFNTVTGSGFFEYKDTTGLVRVAYHNITAEFVFANVSMQTNEVRLGEPVPVFDTVNPGKDLFHVYVADSSIDSFISIARVPALNTNGNPRPMQPFGGSTPLTVQNARTGRLITTSGGPGDVYLGARTKDTPSAQENEANRPIISARFPSGLGILGPRPNGRLTAGLLVEPGQDFGKFYFGGTLTGQVYFGGSVNEVYAGSVYTGQADGSDANGAPSIPENFVVTGDLRNLFVNGNIGTDNAGGRNQPTYLTGFDMAVGGSVGQIRAGGTISGNFNVHNEDGAPHIRMAQRELETRTDGEDRGSLTHFQGNDVPFGTSVNLPRLGDEQGIFNNDSFETAQYLGTFDSRTKGQDFIQVYGNHQYTEEINDPVDYYGVALLAGQTVTVRLFADPFDFGFNELNVGVFDPDNRLIATDYNVQGQEFNVGTPFTFTADRPGVYRFAVSVFGDADFNGGQNGPFSVTFGTETEYRLEISGAGNLAVGGFFAGDDIVQANSAPIIIDEDLDLETVGMVRVQNGDLGGVFAAGFMISVSSLDPTFQVLNGHLRSLTASSMGQVTQNFSSGITLSVPRGHIGLIRTSGAGGENTMLVNTVQDLTRQFDPDFDFDNELDAFLPIGGNIQLVDAAANFHGSLVTSGSIGVIRAGSMGDVANAFSIIAVNADGKGSAGTIDLIDVTGNFGAISPGGPHISTGPGGNVRYVRVGGTIFRDRFFGSGQPEEIVAEAGESLSFVDDSGTLIGLSPIPNVSRINPVTGRNELVNPGTLTASFYGIRGSGGGVLVRVGSTRGIDVTSNSQTGGGSVEIGALNVTGPGTPVVVNTNGTTLDTTDDFIELDDVSGPQGTTRDNDLDATFRGNSPINVYSLTGGQFTSIVNETFGELVNINAGSIGELFANTLGLSKSSTGTAVEGLGFIGTGGNLLGVFEDQRIGVVSGNIVRARSRQGMGNFIVTGIAQEIIANSDGTFTKGEWEGIAGPMVALGGGGIAGSGGGEIRYLNIGEGILPSGTGNMSKSGVYVEGSVRLIENQGLGSDIRGDIISNAAAAPPVFDPDVDPSEIPGRIGMIALTNGSIIRSDIMVVSTFDQGRDFIGGYTLPENTDPSDTNPSFEIGTIGLGGNGGIIGANFVSSDIGNIVVDGGFGIINSQFLTAGLGVTNNIVADGYGIRRTIFNGGGAVNNISARGDGRRLATTAFSSSVRLSEQYAIDPYFGIVPDASTDLHRFLGTTAAEPKRKGVSTAGVIAEVQAAGGREVGLISAFQIKSSAFNFANRIDNIITRDYIDDLEITTGRLNNVQTGGDVFSADWTVAGPIGTVNIGGTYRGSSLVRAVGSNGQIGTFITGRSFWGTLAATNDIGTVRVGTDVGAQGSTSSRGTFAGIDAGRNLNNLIIAGSVLTGADIFVDDHLGNVSIGGDLQEDATISTQSVGTVDIDGDVFGDFVVRG